jgi:hypothetical protein
MSNDAAVYFDQWTASGGDDVVGAASFSAWTAAAAGTSAAVPALEAWTATSFSAPGAHAAITFQEWSATGQAHSAPFGTGDVTLEQWTAAAYDRPQAAGTIEVWTSTGYSRGHVVAAASFEAWYSNQNYGFPSISAWTAAGQSSPALSAVYSAKVMNARTNAVTEYTNYQFNSFAKIGTSYYGVGPNGFFRLDGATDDGANINWTLRTGQHDDKDAGLKRLPEVVMGLRANGAIKVRIHRDDNKYEDYVFAPVNKTSLYQHRAILGKGVRSRYYAVELQGQNNADLELDSMQINMTPTTRRLG